MPVDLEKTSLQLLSEATRFTRSAAQQRKIIHQLQQKIARAFVKQGVAFRKQFSHFKANTVFRETLSNDDIESAWLVAQQTQSQLMQDAIETSVQDALEIGSQSFINTLKVTDYVFELKNPRAVEYLRNYANNQVKGINDTSFKQLKTVILNGVDNGFSYDKIARLIRQEFVDFSTKRAKLIAVTEVGNAYQEGNMIVGRDLAATGLNIQKSWLTRNDNRVDSHCQANQDQDWIDVNTTFSSGVDRPLDHPSCRCVLLFKRATVLVPATKLATTPIIKHLDIADKQIQTDINNAVKALYDRKSVWSGKFDIKASNSSGGIDPTTFDITINSTVYTQYPDRAFKSAVHEMLHSISGSITDPKIHSGIGWEEAVIETLTQRHVSTVATKVGHTFIDKDALETTFATHPYQRYMKPLERARIQAGIDANEFYDTLLPMNITQRRTYLAKVLKKALGNKEGTNAYITLDRALS